MVWSSLAAVDQGERTSDSAKMLASGENLALDTRRMTSEDAGDDVWTEVSACGAWRLSPSP